MRDRLRYWKRIFKVYLTREKGYLSFWHERPDVSEGITSHALGPYYQTFRDKAAYDGPKDSQGVILFDYYFDIGRQYNPLAVAQYGLGHYNLFLASQDQKHLYVAKVQADWLLRNLEENKFGLWVWKHKFQWHYKHYLQPGWYSAHAQGTGISLLARMYKHTKDERYLEAAHKAFESLDTPISDGGVKYIDHNNNTWLEEYLVNPPTHILNGFFWALWGVWDYYVLTKDERARLLFDSCVKTFKIYLPRYDAGFWSLYDLSQQALKMVASPFYHNLHIVQLHATHLITQERIFEDYSRRWEEYRRNTLYCWLALGYKALFKILYF